MAKIINIEKKWQVAITVNSQDCPNQYRKWKPAVEGYFCRETKNRCTRIKCPFKIDDIKNSSFTDYRRKCLSPKLK